MQIRWQDCVYTARIRGIYWNWFDTKKKELPLAAGAEEVIYSATQMLSAERRNRNRLGKLAGMPVYSIPYPQIKKIAALKNHIWRL